MESDCYCVTVAQCSSIDVGSNQKSVFLPSKLGEHCRKKGGKKCKSSGGGIMLCSSFHKMKTFFFKRRKEAPMTVEMQKHKQNKQTKQTRLM